MSLRATVGEDHILRTVLFEMLVAVTPVTRHHSHEHLFLNGLSL